ncbi:MAG: six-hairpin glycosidase [Candidatus Aminicenantes bacterium RBG_13_63_10]|nr:MAG: six-hairpin glycosidase [Candidatus Aminicenantes bacterium RBG_13_63_10]
MEAAVKTYSRFAGIAALAALTLCLNGGDQAPPKKDYPICPVEFTKVKLMDEFWAPRLETNLTVTIPFALKKIEETGRVDNFRKAARLMPGAHSGKRYNDSDVFKVMEGAAYSLSLRPDPALKKKLDDLIQIIGQAQEPDGYLYTARTIDPKKPAQGSGSERWSNLRVSHELYNMGHMYEAAAAHFQATGERSFLDIALRNADLLVRTFGPGLRRGFPGHQEIEIGLAKLYRLTGEKKYLDLAKFFLDERGRYHQGDAYPESSPFRIYNSEKYLQNHKPVLEQTEAVGHAVRAAYMYAGMADVAALGGYPEYVQAIDRIWANVVGRKMYLTGGIGSRGEGEAFGADYDLPNARAYAETCASIGNALWNQRLFLLHGDGRYVDVLERVLYNGLISGVSLGGDLFFYQNPLESKGGYGRSPWFEVACCPGNIARFLPSIPGYVYALGERTLYINLFVKNEATIEVNGVKVDVIVETRYPWLGSVQIVLRPRRPVKFTLAVRMPGWTRNEPVPSGLYRFLDKSSETPAIWVNHKRVALNVEKGYAPLKRKWMRGDTVDMILPMPIRRVLADDRVKDDQGRVALQRGPIVYCVEAADNQGQALNLALPDSSRLQVFFRADLLRGIQFIQGKAVRADSAPADPSKPKKMTFVAVPYAVWANRGPNAMAVWMPRIADGQK